MSTTYLRQIYPSTDVTSLQGFHNAIFGDRENCGKFLIELRDEIVQTAIGISHYVSLDTEKLEIYDTMSVEGAIVTQRTSDGNCLLLETLQLHQELSISESSSIFVTDGTYKIVQVLNQNMSSTFLRQIFPATEVTTFPEFSNAIFGDRHHGGRFLIELRNL